MLYVYIVINTLVVLGFIYKGVKDKHYYIIEWIKENINPLIMLEEKIQSIIENSY
jgi:hypothetical protein